MDSTQQFLSLQQKYNEAQNSYDINYQGMTKDAQLRDVNNLVQMNKQLQNMIKQNQHTDMDFLNSQSTQQQLQLSLDQDRLENQKREIEHSVQEYNSISLKDKNSHLAAYQKLFHFRLLLICLFLLIYLYIEILLGRKHLLSTTTWLLILSFILYFLDIQLISFVVLVIAMLQYIARFTKGNGNGNGNN